MKSVSSGKTRGSHPHHRSKKKKKIKKKKCEQLDLERLGYSCKLLNEQSDEITPPHRADRG